MICGAAEGYENVACLKRRNSQPSAAPTGGVMFSEQTNKTPERVSDQGFWNLILTMTYSHMGKPHTTIGDASFHC